MYKCTCRTTFNLLHIDVLRHLLEAVKLAMPFLPSKKSGLSKSFVDTVVDSLLCSSGFAEVARRRRSEQERLHGASHLAYLLDVEAWRKQFAGHRPAQRSVADFFTPASAAGPSRGGVRGVRGAAPPRRGGLPPTLPFRSFVDVYGRKTSAAYITKMVLSFLAVLAPWFVAIAAENVGAGKGIVSCDDTVKVTKFLRGSEVKCLRGFTLVACWPSLTSPAPLAPPAPSRS